METIIKKEDYKSCLQYIDKYWRELIYYHPKDKHLHLGLPNKYVIPCTGIFKKDQFYWDTYFIVIGLVKCGKVDLAKGMIDNLVFLFKKFNIMPMRNRYYNLGISQIPFLTSMAMEVFQATKRKSWLLKIIQAAESELKNYWMNDALVEKHIVYKNMSRYCDHYITHLAAEHESGWDMTSRFNDHCLDYLPVDLNSCLYKYEIDIAKWNSNKKKVNIYMENSEKRQRTISKLMWNDKKGFFFDYNYKHKKQSNFYSLAGFYPLWAKTATLSQAMKVRDALVLFEYKGGLANTQSHSLSDEFKQHDYPNGWAQQHWIVIRGLLNYGFEEDAKRIAKKWLDLNKNVFLKTGKFWEKYNVVTCKVGESNADRYPTQSGFGWTNAVFVRLINEFE
ncbi:MAG TPA: trehalase family glycosidase [Bacteroidia bacterium]|nr:trehalase family glycosidase [Bacteroidia bacterium]